MAEDYGVLVPQYGIAERVTFVVDKGGKISYIEHGADAVKIVGAGEACSRLERAAQEVNRFFSVTKRGLRRR